MAQALEKDLTETTTDLLIVNRFGRSECVGRESRGGLATESFPDVLSFVETMSLLMQRVHP